MNSHQNITNISSKFKSSLTSRIEEKINTDVTNLSFKSQENLFINTLDNKKIKSLNGFTILTILDRFFYTDNISKSTYISNLVVDKSESISFSLWKSKVSLFWKQEFSFDELDKLCYEWIWLNRKIIIIWIYEWKLTKLESHVTSEKSILLYLKDFQNEKTANISSTEKKFKENTVNILSLEKSQNQLNLSTDEENEFFNELEEHIKTLNHNLFSNWDTSKESKEDTEEKEQKNNDDQLVFDF